MYEGTVATGTLLGTLTGTLPDDPNARHFEATGQSMLVEFTSDASVGGNGFEAQYSCAHTVPPNTGPTDQDCTPVRINSDRPTEGHVDATAPTAYFCLTAVAGATYDLTVTLGTLQDSVMDLYGADRRTSIAHNDDSPGTFYIGVRGFQPQLEGDFSLDVTQETDDHGSWN